MYYKKNEINPPRKPQKTSHSEMYVEETQEIKKIIGQQGRHLWLLKGA